jgi:hypothetical protein
MFTNSQRENGGYSRQSRVKNGPRNTRHKSMTQKLRSGVTLTQKLITSLDLVFDSFLRGSFVTNVNCYY